MNKWVKRILVVLICLFVVGATYNAAELDVEWQKNLDEFNYIEDVVLTSDEGYIVGGSGSPSGTMKTQVGLIAKLNRSGEIEWTHSLGDRSVGSVSDIIVISDGNYLVLDVVLVDNQRRDARITKFAEDGSILWSSTAGFLDSAMATTVLETSDGGFVAVGTVNSRVDYQSHDLAFLVKFDKNGNLLWRQMYDAEAGRGFIDFELLEGDKVIVVGSVTKPTFYEDGVAQSGRRKAQLTVLDSSGSEISNFIYERGDVNSFYNIERTEGGFLLSGSESTNVGYDSVLTYVSIDGMIIWEKHLGDQNSIVVNDVVEVANDNVLLVTQKRSQEHQTRGGYLQVIDSSGNSIWNSDINKFLSLFMSSAIQTDDSGYVAVGALEIPHESSPATFSGSVTKISPKFELTFDINGGTRNAPEMQYVFLNALAKQPVTPEKDGYLFTGWNTTPDGKGTIWDFNTSKMSDSNLVLYAQWQKIDSNSLFNLSFNINGMEGVTTPPTQPLKQGQLGTYASVSAPGYVLKGWNTASDGSGTYWDFTTMTMPAKHVELFAIWQKNNPEIYTMNLDTNGGSEVLPKGYTGIEGIKLTGPSQPLKEGYTFKGWNTALDGSGSYWNFDTMPLPAYNLTLYAQWQKNTTLPATGIASNSVISIVLITMGLMIVLNKKRFKG